MEEMEQLARGIFGITLCIGGTILENVADHVGTATETVVNIHTPVPCFGKMAKHTTGVSLQLIGHGMSELGKEILEG